MKIEKPDNPAPTNGAVFSRGAEVVRAVREPPFLPPTRVFALFIPRSAFHVPRSVGSEAVRAVREPPLRGERRFPKPDPNDGFRDIPAR